MWDYGDVWGWYANASEGGESASGGYGGDKFEWEGEFGNFDGGYGTRREKEREERRREEKIRGVLEEDEEKERDESEKREKIRCTVCVNWSVDFSLFLVFSLVLNSPPVEREK